MRMYVPGENGDVGLLHWYANLVSADDLHKLLGPSLWPMAAFMEHFRHADALWVLEDAQGWKAVAWTYPMISGGTWGLWVRPNGRQSRETLEFIMTTLDLATQTYPVLVNTTKQPDVVAKTERLGYTYLGKVPYLFEGEDCFILYMTRAMFEPILERWRAHGTSRGTGKNLATARV